MRKTESIGEMIFDVFNVFLMCLLMILTLYPLLHVAFASISNGTELMAHSGPIFYPLGKINFNAYKAVYSSPMTTRGFLNTIFIVVVGVTLNIIMTSIGAYFLSRKNVYWKKLITFLIIFTMFFNGGLIPFYFTVKQLHLDNTLWALIIPSAISTFNLIILRTAFASIPISLEESAKLDGASHFTILTKIIMPLSMPTIAVLILYYGVGHWNSWFNAMIFLRKRNLYPIQLILREILLQNDTSLSNQSAMMDQESIAETIKYATIIVATIPILIVYPFLQKYFVKGVMIGAVKE